MTDAEIRAEAHYYETLELAHLVGVPGEDPMVLLLRCTNALLNLRLSLVEHFAVPGKSLVN